MRVSDFDYELPREAIAQEAIEPRDAARLLVISTMGDHRFSELPALLRPGDLLVVNQTRVRAARLRGRRVDTGGTVELLLLRRIDAERWEALARPARRLRPGISLDFGAIVGEVASPPREGAISVRLTTTEGDVEDLLPTTGEVPLPPYFAGHLADDDRYQTIFAKTIGSAAAPTAALHFTPRVLEALAARNIGVAEVDLEIGLDTFRPMMGERVADHVIHRERYVIPEEAVRRIDATRREGGRVVAVGTTVVRTLETAADPSGSLRAGEGESDLFIVPGHEFRVVDALITNFHAPRTTLVALVAAAIGPTWRDVYRAALERGYRFLSFGDAMLIDRLGAA
jgi:S-adenosylmethionine:tRNA ribosyltransferase-isomerase